MMMPDRMEGKKERDSVYALARKKAAEKKQAKAATQAATPAPELVTGAGPGQSQPTFSVDDPFLQAGLEVPAGITAPLATYGAPGSFDKRQDKVGRAQGREKSLHVYKSPAEYYGQLETVMGSPVMKNLSEGLAQYKAMHENFLKHAPVQTDLSSLMGLADFLSDKPGKALASYKKPDSYNDLVGKLAGLMQQEQGANYNVANLAMNQVPLKAGEESASSKAEVGQEADRGFAVPRPPGPGLAGSLINAEKWYTDKTQKNLQEFATYRDQLDALESALGRGDIGSITRAMGLAARLLSGEKGVITDKDIGRVLPKTIGQDASALESYLTNNPSVLLNPMTLIGIKEEVLAAKERLLKRYNLNQQTFDDTLRGSPSMGGIPDRMGWPARERLKDMGPTTSAPQESDRMKEFKKLLERK